MNMNHIDPDIDLPKKSSVNSFLVEWIKQNLIPIKSNYNLESSYGLKHKFEYATGLYVDNGEFKYAMDEAGFKPVDKTTKNWLYRISKKSLGLEWHRTGIKRNNKDFK